MERKNNGNISTYTLYRFMDILKRYLLVNLFQLE
jgi:hypothetical protein